MSLNYKPLRPVLVKDPRVIIDNEREYAVLQSGKRFTNKQWTTNSVSSSNINFTTPPPSRSIIMDRRVSLTLPQRIFITATVAPGERVLAPNADAPRAFPIHSQLDTVNMSINNCTVTQTMGEIIHALLRYNNSDDLSEMDYSETASYLDNSQNYNDLFMANRSCLGTAGNACDGSVVPRGGYCQYKVIFNEPNPVTDPVNTTWFAVVDMVCTEQIFLSPLYFGSFEQNHSGFLNVTSNDWTFNFLNQAGNRCWSHNPARNMQNNTDVSVFKSVTTQYNQFITSFDAGRGGDPIALPSFSFPSQMQPILNINYITPEDSLMVGPHTPLCYPYFDVTKYVTDTGVVLTYAGQKTGQLVSNNINLSSIPRRLLIYARETNNQYYSNSSRTDTFYAIQNVSIQFENYSGLFASATQNQLWEMSRKNHCNISWSDWSGNPVYKNGGTDFDYANNTYGGTGSVLCIEFATDIGLDAQNAPGVGNSSYNLQMTVNVKNIDPTGSHDTSQISLYIIAIAEGVFNIQESGAAMTQLSVLTQMDVLDAKPSHYISYNDVQEINGGNFYSGLRNFGNKLMKGNQYLRDKKLISKGAEALSYIPGPQSGIIRGVHDVADALGYGYDGGVVVGAGKMKKKTLKTRARRV